MAGTKPTPAKPAKKKAAPHPNTGKTVHVLTFKDFDAEPIAFATVQAAEAEGTRLAQGMLAMSGITNGECGWMRGPGGSFLHIQCVGAIAPLFSSWAKVKTLRVGK